MFQTAITIAILLFPSTVSSSGHIRGLDPALLPRYTASSGSFICLDELKTIKHSDINDQYCDCFDGSDEPGTSACVNGKFYCPNRGYIPQVLNASFVDDSFCDCCDGSDEPPGLCANVCSEAGAAARAELRQRAEAEAAGAAAREDYVRRAQEATAAWAAEDARLTRDIAAQRRLTSAWQARKEAVEERERKQQEREKAAAAALEAERAAEVARLAASAPAQPAVTDNAEEALAAAGDPTGDHVTATVDAVTAATDGGAEGSAPDPAASELAEAALAAAGDPAADHVTATVDASPFGGGAVAAADEIISGALGGHGGVTAGDDAPAEVPIQEVLEAEAAQDGAHHMGGAVVEPAAEEETAEERARRIASQWIRDDSQAPPLPLPPPEAGVELEGVAEAEEVAALEATSSTEPAASALQGALAWAKALAQKLLGYLPWQNSGAAASGAQKVKDEYWKQHGQLTELERRQAELRKQMGHDFGPSGAFLALLDRCFQADVDKYVYEICPYKDAHQKDGASSISLGSWKGFEDDYGSMVFSGGQHCWNGPMRSIKVAVSCGATEVLKHVEEPNRCEYAAHLTTPAACSAELAEQMQQQLREAEQVLPKHEEL